MSDFDFTKNYSKEEILAYLKGFTITSSRAAHTDKQFEKDADAWSVTVRNPRGKTFTTKFYKGRGHHGAKPTLPQVMGSVISEAKSVEHVNVQGWAEDFGYEWDDADPKERAHLLSIYTRCEQMGKRLEAFLTPEESYMFEEWYNLP